MYPRDYGSCASCGAQPGSVCLDMRFQSHGQVTDAVVKRRPHPGRQREG